MANTSAAREVERCGLRQVRRNGATRSVVSLSNGTTYNVLNRCGQLLLVDSSGTWPVAVVSQGSTGLFRWRGTGGSAPPVKPTACPKTVRVTAMVSPPMA
ncbi:hypothetical protein [Cyanobium sp. Morenito 9A2]|uniref:hypothetical protein n=1 Tax=Cyanobium sp. Morenito 9A2 TaxID=2823718 RepID=UPI0020CBBB3F|nr:hypothetical protein [Cyanobium sp. Morenito 9A2]MCP9848546.1 hypothetical protein [Cyanobium sp. Morenito 9A2]